MQTKNHIKKVFPLFLISSFLFFYSSCNKDTAYRVEIIQETNPYLNHTDSAAALTNYWNVIKDSLTNIGDYYAIENGNVIRPNGGVYIGFPGDYHHFRTDGTYSMHENQYTFHMTYTFVTPNKLIVPALVHGPGTILKLTPSELVIYWSNTSPNGGQYYRRVYLKR